MYEPDSAGPTPYWGLLRAQGLAVIALALLLSIAMGPEVILVVLWGGMISLLAFAWAGYQLWLHPGNRRPARQASAAIRAEAGKVVIVLVLFWLTLKSWPDVRTGSKAIILMSAFFWTYVAGLIWLHFGTKDGDDEHQDV